MTTQSLIHVELVFWVPSKEMEDIFSLNVGLCVMHLGEAARSRAIFDSQSSEDLSCGLYLNWKIPQQPWVARVITGGHFYSYHSLRYHLVKCVLKWIVQIMHKAKTYSIDLLFEDNRWVKAIVDCEWVNDIIIIAIGFCMEKVSYLAGILIKMSKKKCQISLSS